MTTSLESSLTDRALVNSWVLVSGFRQYTEKLKEQFPEISSIMDSAIGYIYVDHDCGISLKIECLCSISSPADTITSYQLIGNIFSLRFRYSSLKTLHFTELSREKVAETGLPYVPDWLEFYETPALKIIRGFEWLDPLRASGFFDDVMVILPHTDRVPEIVWVRLYDYLPETHRFKGALLNEPFHDAGIHRNDSIELEPDGDSLICVLSKIPKENRQAPGT